MPGGKETGTWRLLVAMALALLLIRSRDVAPLPRPKHDRAVLGPRP
jgi:hypothetical protein